jgi:isoleucyl-tRNA synthetase
MLCPILAFTTDEAWEFVPGNKEASVHQSTWMHTSISSISDEEKWSVAHARAGLFEIRNLVLPELEKARQAKLIGKSLDAKVEIVLEDDQFVRANVEQSKYSAQELLNVSQLEIAFAEKTPNLPVIKVTHADGQKCERCWHWETDVGSHPDHPTICARCVEAVKQHATA